MIVPAALALTVNCVSLPGDLVEIQTSIWRVSISTFNFFDLHNFTFT